jgi:hypothetical protein
MENPILSVTKGPQGQKKQKNKGQVKSAQANPPVAACTQAQSQGQQAGQCKPQAV